jgi:hypothetical protein
MNFDLIYMQSNRRVLDNLTESRKEATTRARRILGDISFAVGILIMPGSLVLAFFSQSFWLVLIGLPFGQAVCLGGTLLFWRGPARYEGAAKRIVAGLQAGSPDPRIARDLEGTADIQQAQILLVIPKRL